MSNLSRASQKALIFRRLADHYDRRKKDAKEKLIQNFEGGQIHDSILAPHVAHFSYEQKHRILDSDKAGPETTDKIVAHGEESHRNKIVNTPRLFNQLTPIGIQYLSSFHEHHEKILTVDPKKINYMAGQRLTNHAMFIGPERVKKVFSVLAKNMKEHYSNLGRLTAHSMRYNIDLPKSDGLDK
jgi:hypothetical protein